MTPNPPLRWRPSPLIWITIAVHAGALLLVLVSPHEWRWALGAVLIDHALFTAAGLWPRSTWLGPNWTRLPAGAAARKEIALTIDDGPDPEVTPRVLDLLDRHGVKATFFCIGERAARHPDICRMIASRGHEIENHSQHHFHHFSVMGPRALRREILTAQETLASVAGRAPLFFRAPAGLRNLFLEPVLARLGLRLAAWTRRGFDTRSGNPDVVHSRLVRGVKPGAILLLHDSNCARTASGEPVILAVLPRLIEAAGQAGLRFVTLSSTLGELRS